MLDLTVLLDISALKQSDIESGNISKTIENLLKNLKKEKNLFLYYPYEFSSKTDLQGSMFEEILSKAFSVIMNYRTEEQPNFDTFICIKVNKYFFIYEWTTKGFVFRDQVHEIFCGNYLGVKQYFIY